VKESARRMDEFLPFINWSPSCPEMSGAVPPRRPRQWLSSCGTESSYSLSYNDEYCPLGSPTSSLLSTVGGGSLGEDHDWGQDGGDNDIDDAFINFLIEQDHIDPLPQFGSNVNR